MHQLDKRLRRSLVVVGAAGVVMTGALAAQAATPTDVRPAQPKTTGVSSPNSLSSNLQEIAVATGDTPLDNPSPGIGYYGYDSDGPLVPAAGSTSEATKTEPDKNTYLVLPGQTGPDPGYHYGTHFLFQGHEAGPGYLTRINLDANLRHRVTVMATTDSAGQPIPTIDGSTWDPFAKRLLLTSEKGSAGVVLQATSTFPSTVDRLDGVLGNGSYEGIQNDNLGNVYIVEDASGAAGTLYPNAKQPNSYIYKFVPTDPTDLTKGGQLKVLQLASLAFSRAPIVESASPDADIAGPDIKDMHTFGNTFGTKWVTIHDTAIDGTAPFDANALAKPVATPFKRPENGVFKPGSGFTQFFFTETGDTNTMSEAGAGGGGFGAIFKLTQDAPDADTGILQLFYLGGKSKPGESDPIMGLDNIMFTSPTTLTAVEDAGDTAHTQRGRLDSAYLFNTSTNYGATNAPAPVRWLAEGRDPSATLDSGFEGQPGFQNSGDNEITGITVSDGDASAAGLLGAKSPVGFVNTSWKTFWTQQHGTNTTWQVTGR